MRRKGDLPTKVCPVCGRPFAWRKRWSRTWDAVVYCSEACRRRKAEVCVAHTPAVTDEALR